ncbi:MAG: glycine--tRNA ligase subunit beta [Acidobacteria bacterium RIFCSPLOWO2_12_FULL_60_22]|nr:MAG: glycine--tRNA ligase subunit beta [Acidobacteria bacterium RIFCSPLOWO2_12_FULL_60_22]
MIEGGLADLKRLLEEGFERFRLFGEPRASLEMYGTPRRLIAYCPRLLVRQASSVETMQGPPQRVAFDAQGKPTAAATSFAAKMGTKIEKLETVSTPKGEYLVFRKQNPGRPTPEILAEMIPLAVLGISFPRSMYWEGKAGPRFIRPIRSLLALYGGKVVPCSIGAVKAASWTFGHRLLGKPRLPVRDFAGYREALRNNYVLIDPQERRARILDGVRDLLPSDDGLRLKPNEELLNTLVYLTEYPTPLLGEFDPAFLALPEEVLITVMKGHQKYLSLEQADGALAPRFVAVLDRDADPAGAIRHGHERVLRARFNDARFFWETDGKTGLEKRLQALRQVTFQSQLGSYFEKADRMRRLAAAFATRLGRAEKLEDIQVAARLAKCDLTTQLVKEFTELQGVVGGLSARREGLSDEIATAIYDHYKPANLESPSPRTLAGAVVSLADRMDTLAGCFGVGLAPSGSKDPLGLRRAANGVIKILVDHVLRLPLSQLVEDAAAVYQDAKASGRIPDWDHAVVLRELRLFLVDRLRYYLRDVRGFAYDEVNAVLAAGSEDVVDVVERAEAVARVRPTENFEPLAVAFKRIQNILRQAQAAGFTGGELDPSLLEPGPERQLYERYRTVAELVARQKQEGDYWAALEAIASLRPDVDRFFDKGGVMVMAPEENLRQNRLVLLQGLLREFSTIADFFEIVTAEEEKRKAP